MSRPAIPDRPLVLFDGRCPLCDRTVRTLLRLDDGGVLRFAPLQSPTGRRILEEHGLDPERFDTFVLVEGREVRVRSDAALAVGRHLGGPWRALAAVGRLVPRGLRDAVYDFIARRRFRWFGRLDEGSGVPEGWEGRFVDRADPGD